MTTRLAARVRQRIDELDARGLRRSLTSPSGIDLSSNDYLGLSDHPRLVQQMIDAVAREGVGSTGSRLLRGERESFSAIERRFADWKGTDRALYFSSGYLANLAVLTTLTEPGDVVYSDASNHASLIDGLRLSRAARVIFPHNDVDALERLLHEPTGPGQRFVVTESLFSMDGDMAPLADYAALCRETDTALVVDEAHAVGIYGSRGSGLVEEAGVDADGLVTVNTAGKALGVSGAFVAGPDWAIEHLVQRARPFIFTTAPPPALAAALDASLTIVCDEPERRARLLSRARVMRDRLAEAGIDVAPGRSQIIPIVIGDNARAVAVSRDLQHDGFDVRAIRPPSVPEGTARLRIAVNVNLSESTIERFVSALTTATRRLGPCVEASS
jgi:8-amino-7-oxononanoate synthase